MGRPGAIVTRMNPHGWIFLRRRLNLLQSLSFFSKTPLAIVFCSQACGRRGRSGRYRPRRKPRRPGGNVTGQSSGVAEVAGKRLPPLTLTR
jgi:hypothetical protein